MKSKVNLLSVVLLFVGSMGALFAQSAPRLVDSVSLETFDTGTSARDWIVVGSRYSKEGFPKLVYVDSTAVDGLTDEQGAPLEDASVYPDALKSETGEADTAQRVLGIYSEFSQKGRNSFEIIPVAVGTTDPSPIYFKGVVDSVSLWVWGGNFDYYLDACFIDNLGNIHRIPIGTLDYIGWQKKTIKIPHTVSQMQERLPNLKPLQFVKFIVTTQKIEDVEDFYIYLDDIRYSAYDYANAFDGDEFISPDFIKKLWGVEVAVQAEGK